MNKLDGYTKNELNLLRQKLLKELAAKADRIGEIDKLLATIRGNELEEILLEAEPKLIC